MTRERAYNRAKICALKNQKTPREYKADETESLHILVYQSLKFSNEKLLEDLILLSNIKNS